MDYLEIEAENLATRWLTKYRVEIKSLSDERQETYRQIREMSSAAYGRGPRSADVLDATNHRPQG